MYFTESPRAPRRTTPEKESNSLHINICTVADICCRGIEELIRIILTGSQDDNLLTYFVNIFA